MIPFRSNTLISAFRHDPRNISYIKHDFLGPNTETSPFKYMNNLEGEKIDEIRGDLTRIADNDTRKLTMR